MAPHEQPPPDPMRVRFGRTVWWQVYLPLVAGALVMAVLVALGLSARGGGEVTASGMADVALVLLLLPMMVLGVIALVVLVLLALGMDRVIVWLPGRSQRMREVVAQVAQQSDRIASRVVQVIIVPKSAWQAGGAFVARLLGKE